MPFDVFTMAAVRDELDARVRGARVDKVLQPADMTVALKLWRPGFSGSLIMSAAASQARVYLTDAKTTKGFETPSPFLMLLRKYCIGARIGEIRQDHLERILRIDMTTGEHGQVTLIAECMGNRSNLILTSTDEVLGAGRLIGPKQSRVRRIFPHVPYVAPPAQARGRGLGDGEKIDPLAATTEAIGEALENADPDLRLGDTLVGLFRGCSPTVAGDIAVMAGRDSLDLLHDIALPELTAAVLALFSLFESRAWTPVVIRRDGIATDYKAYAVPAVEGAECVETISVAIEAVAEDLETSDALRAARARVRGTVDRRRNEVLARTASLNRGMDTAGEADRLLEAGNMVLGFQYQIEAGAESLEIPDGDMTIALDPKLTTVENAERYFKRYRKARDAAKRIPLLLRTAQSDLDFVEELDAYVDMAESPADLARVEADLGLRFGSNAAQGKQKPTAAGRPLTVDLDDGIRILVGKSARQNEEVTFKLAGRGDLWLHARGVPGSHVVLRGAKAGALDDPDPAAAAPIRSAASLAAYYSKARTERAVDVIVTRVRDVHRVPGGAPGQVTVHGDRTVRVRPAPPGEFTRDS